MSICLLIASLLMTPDTTDTLPYYPAPIETVEVAGRSIAYYDAQTDGPPVLFVHGLGSNLSFWRENLSAFAEEHRVLALDLPGYGLSEKTDVPGTMEFYAETVVGFLDALGIAEVDYVGVSMGAQIGVTLALMAPERVRRLVLVSPAGIERFTEAEGAVLKQALTPESIQRMSAAQYRRSLALNFANYDAARYGWIAEQRQTLSARDDFAQYAVANARSVAGMLTRSAVDRLGEVEAPVLILFGAGDNLIPNPYLHPELTTADVAETAQQALPDAEIRMIDEAGHLLMIERPAVFNETVRAFLAR